MTICNACPTPKRCEAVDSCMYTIAAEERERKDPDHYWLVDHHPDLVSALHRWGSSEAGPAKAMAWVSVERILLRELRK